MNAAVIARKNKELHPERYCANPRCLWRTGGPNGSPCPKHRAPQPCEVCGRPDNTHRCRSAECYAYANREVS